MSEINDQKKGIAFGNLRDEKTANEIILSLRKEGIECSVKKIEKENKEIFFLYVYQKEDLLHATDFFRVKMGLAKPLEIPKEWEEIKKVPMGNFSFFIIGICLLIFGVGYLLEEKWLYEFLKFPDPSAGMTIELWRFFTPCLIHFGFLHIIFNLLWWKDLGSLIEESFGIKFLVFFTLTSGVFSNFLQGYMVGKNFGGMSGVVYGLLGFIWIYKKMNSKFSFSLPKQDVFLMLLWLVLGFFDVFSFKMANWAHGGGLVYGMLLALVLGRFVQLKPLK